ncbi:AGAP009214-PA-like protein [Anopheles sinensis]|uniref:AGAP009214-PA-like protein n=1 Tax=Anopheles sinensis TaxID=74873 RepID=A0A084WQM1_ANOSI|nr:AGAP009214-PA-like protein [Anopheles sinensis]
MHPTTLVFSLSTIVFSQIVLTNQQLMPKACSSAEPCTDISQCDLFAPYNTKPAKWSQGLKDAFMARYCKREASPSGGNLFKVCCPKSSITPPVRELRRRIDLLDLEGCGPYSEDRIAHGNKTKLFQYPWMALLRSNGAWICGGTLINDRYVLTAAHCVKDTTIDTVRLGEYDLSKSRDCDTREDVCAPPPQDIRIERTIIHEQYSARRKVNDIALLRLARDATKNENVIPICLPVTPELQQTALKFFFVAGWGTTESKTSSDVLLFTKLVPVTNDECQTEIVKEDRFVKIVDTQVCARGEQSLSDNCSGDSGGPLKTLSTSARFVQYGVVSFGLRTCGVRSSVGVYTRIESYIDWILDKLED